MGFGNLSPRPLHRSSTTQDALKLCLTHDIKNTPHFKIFQITYFFYLMLNTHLYVYIFFFLKKEKILALATRYYFLSFQIACGLHFINIFIYIYFSFSFQKRNLVQLNNSAFPIYLHDP